MYFIIAMGIAIFADASQTKVQSPQRTCAVLLQNPSVDLIRPLPSMSEHGLSPRLALAPAARKLLLIFVAEELSRRGFDPAEFDAVAKDMIQLAPLEEQIEFAVAVARRALVTFDDRGGITPAGLEQSKLLNRFLMTTPPEYADLLIWWKKIRESDPEDLLALILASVRDAEENELEGLMGVAPELPVVMADLLRESDDFQPLFFRFQHDSNDEKIWELVRTANPLVVEMAMQRYVDWAGPIELAKIRDHRLFISASIDFQSKVSVDLQRFNDLFEIKHAIIKQADRDRMTPYEVPNRGAIEHLLSLLKIDSTRAGRLKNIAGMLDTLRDSYEQTRAGGFGFGPAEFLAVAREIFPIVVKKGGDELTRAALEALIKVSRDFVLPDDVRENLIADFRLTLLAARSTDEFESFIATSGELMNPQNWGRHWPAERPEPSSRDLLNLIHEARQLLSVSERQRYSDDELLRIFKGA